MTTMSTEEAQEIVIAMKTQVNLNEAKRQVDSNEVEKHLSTIEKSLVDVNQQLADPSFGKDVSKAFGPVFNDVGYQLRLNTKDLFSDDPLRQSIGSLNVVSAAATAMDSIKALGDFPGIIGGIMSLISGILSLISAALVDPPRKMEDILKDLIEDAFRDAENKDIDKLKTDAMSTLVDHYTDIENAIKMHAAYPENAKEVAKVYVDGEYHRDGHEFFAAVESDIEGLRKNFENTMNGKDNANFEEVKKDAISYGNRVAAYTLVATKRRHNIETLCLLTASFGDDLAIRLKNVKEGRINELNRQKKTLMQYTDSGKPFLFFQRPDFNLRPDKAGSVEKYIQGLDLEYPPAQFYLKATNGKDNYLITEGPSNRKPVIYHGYAEKGRMGIWTFEKSDGGDDDFYMKNYEGDLLRIYSPFWTATSFPWEFAGKWGFSLRSEGTFELDAQNFTGGVKISVDRNDSDQLPFYNIGFPSMKTYDNGEVILGHTYLRCHDDNSIGYSDFDGPDDEEEWQFEYASNKEN